MSNSPKPPAGLIPERRFPRFSGPWVHEALSSVLTEHKVKNAARHDVFSVSMEFGIVNQIEHLGRSFAAADTSHYNVGHPFDVVYTKSPLKAFPLGIVKQCKSEEKVALSPLYGVFTPKNPHVGLLIEAYFEVPERANAFLSPLCQKGAKNTLQITNATFLSGRMALPKDEGEQQKVADCLASADALITAQARMVEVLKAYKKGLMQQLFPKEGETQPRLRFPEFELAGGWEPRTVGSACTSFSGGTPSTSNPYFYGGDIPFIRSAEIGKEATELSLTRAGLENSSAKMVKKGDVLIALYGANSGDVAIAKIAGAINQAILCLRPSGNGPFLSQFLTYRKDWIIKKYLQGGQGNLSGEIVKSVVLAFPSPKEQQRIAECLTSLDDRIAAETRKLDTLKTHKKGLMQQVFPKTMEKNA